VRYRNAILFLILAAVWGSAFMAIKAGLDPAYFGPAPVLFAAVRYDVAGLLMLGYAAYATDHPRPVGVRQWAAVAVGAVFLIAGYHAFLFVGETDPAVTSAGAAVIVSLSPVLTTFFARAFLPEERLTAVGVAGLLLGLVGVALLARPDPGNLLAGGFVAKGLVLCAVLLFAFGSVITRWLDAALPIETMEAYSMIGGAALMHVASLAIGESPAVAVRALTGPGALGAIAALAYLSLAASAAGFLIYFDLLDRLGPVEINLVSYVAPVFAAVAGFAVLGEVVDALTVVGFLVICVGFALLKRREIRRELPVLRAAVSRTGERGD
jgi:drug/metabolite transporter (DMT)-like permease